MALDAVTMPLETVNAPFDASAVSLDEDFAPFDAVREAFFGGRVLFLEKVSHFWTDRVTSRGAADGRGSRAATWEVVFVAP